jgi:hypothetical protein
MKAEIFAEWLTRQGHRVIQTKSSYWVETAPRIYQAFPYHWTISPEEDELREIIIKRYSIGLRFSAPIDYHSGAASYHVVQTDKDYDLKRLSKKARYDIRKALSIYSFRSIPLRDLVDEGWALRQETLARQKRLGYENYEWWKKLCLGAEGLPGIEAWAASVDGHLAAALIAITCEDCCSVIYQQSKTMHLSQGVNNALTYTFTRMVMGRGGIKSIFYGLHSLDAQASVDEFKFRLGYTAKRVRQRVVFHPGIMPFMNRVSYAALRRIISRRSGSSSLSKAEGMFRFYIEGKRPLSEQAWPKAILRDEIA